MKSLLENIDLMSFKINFNYRKKDVYHSYFSIFISLCVYVSMVFFLQYFSKDFVNKTNPKVIYQETEFTQNFTIPLDSILSGYFYNFSFESMDNIYNLSSNEQSKTIYNQTNDIFSLQFTLYNTLNYSVINITEKINIITEKKIY